MGRSLLRAVLVPTVLLGLWPGSLVASARAQATAPGAPSKSVRGKLELIDKQLNGIIMMTDEGKRVAWKFDAAIIGRLAPFKPGDPVIVIYRQQGGSKTVTALAFPGTAPKPVYVNTSGDRVQLVGGPILDGVCGQPSETPLSTTTIPDGGQAELAEACWCCAPAGESCIPGNKTGAGKAFLAHCYK
jgi:hypothetical protein